MAEKNFFKKWEEELQVFVLYTIMLILISGFFFMLEDREIREGNESLRIIGTYMLVVIAIPIASYLLLRIVHFIVNLPARFFPTKTKYSRDIPDMHPAIASFLDKCGTLSLKRILSSSLLHLVALDVLSIEKRENAQGKETIVFIQKYEDVDALDITGIDKLVLNLVDFVICDRLAKRNNARIEELENYGLSSQVTHVAFLEDFSVVAKKEKKEYREYVQKINDAIEEDLKNRKLLSIINTRGYWNWTYYMLTYYSLIFLIPAGVIILFPLPLGVVMRIVMAIFSALIGIALYVFFPDFSNVHLPLSWRGYGAAAKLRPLKRWLKDFTLLEEKDTLSANVWKEYIAYASAFGLPPAVYDDLSSLTEYNDELVKILIDELASDY